MPSASSSAAPSAPSPALTPASASTTLTAAWWSISAISRLYISAIYLGYTSAIYLGYIPRLYISAISRHDLQQRAEGVGGVAEQLRAILQKPRLLEVYIYVCGRDIWPRYMAEIANPSEAAPVRGAHASFTRAISAVYLGCISRLYVLAISRLYLGYISAISRRAVEMAVVLRERAPLTEGACSAQTDFRSIGARPIYIYIYIYSRDIYPRCSRDVAEM
jgi:hypothetical protein